MKNNETNTLEYGTNMNFSQALYALKRGEKVARKGWNGKNQFVYMVAGDKFPAQNKAIKGYFKDDLVPYLPYFALKNAQDTVATWVPSVGDLLAEDWEVVE
jgi:hypothetical protein